VSETLGYARQIAEGAGWTIVVAACSFVAGTVLGIGGAAMRLSRYRLLRLLGLAYVTVIRSVPELLIILLIYFGGTVLVSALSGGALGVNALGAGILALSVVFGGYATEILRAAWEAVPRGQAEAARALGLRPLQALRLVIAPQMLRLALPALGNLWLVLLKETSLISVVGMEEIMRSAHIAAGATRQPMLFYGVAAAIYMMLTAVSQVGWARLSRQLDRGFVRG
jgi:putative lysine/arginine/ornithine/histidine/octopine transport system permease protein